VTACCPRIRRSNVSDPQTSSTMTKSTSSTGKINSPRSAMIAEAAGAAAKPKFSFLKTLDRRMSAPGRMTGDFIPLGQSEKSNVGSISRGNMIQSSGAGKSCMARSASNRIASQQQRQGQARQEQYQEKERAEGSEEVTGVKRGAPLTLAELEKLRKKKEKQKRRNTSGSIATFSSGTTGNMDGGAGAVAGAGGARATPLSSLQNVFKRKL
jgi:hypothetical protein